MRGQSKAPRADAVTKVAPEPVDADGGPSPRWRGDVGHGSWQLLRRAGLVTSRRAGKAVIYRMMDDKALNLIDFIGQIAWRNLSVVDEFL